MATLRPAIDVDEADVLVFTQGLERASKVTVQINKSLRNIATTTGHSSRLFAPIITRNNVLSTLQRNIESALNSVASVKDLANEASKHEMVLRKGFREVGLKQYIQAIHKLDDMLDDIKAGNFKRTDNSEFTGIQTHLKDLIRKSETNLRVYFVSVLRTIKPFDPQININKKIPFPYYNDEQLAEMALIIDYFHNAFSDAAPIEDVFIQERSEMILKCMAFLEPFAKKVASSDNTPYERDSGSLLSYTEALSGFVANEKSLVDDLYLQELELKPKVFTGTIKPLLGAYVRLVETNLAYVRKNLENAGILSFELADSVHNVRRALKGGPLENYGPISECSKNVHTVTQSLFKDVIQRIGTKVNQMSAIPADNGVTESTVDTMSRLRKFSEYKAGCLGAMENMRREMWLPTPHKEKEFTFNVSHTLREPSALLSCFLSDCIDLLIVSLERRAQRILMPNQEPDVANPNSSKNTHKPRIGFFIIMNMALIEQIVDKSNLGELLGSEGHVRMEKLKKRYINYLVSDWRDLASNLMDSVFVDSTGKISSKDKDQIKEKFKRFNEGFEELVSKYKQYRLSDPGLKAMLKSEIVSLVMPMYERFYRRYKDSFKNPRKHIKYLPDELTSVLNQLGK